MSEYIDFDFDLSEDQQTMHISSNLPLADGDAEHYATPEAMDEGSPVAQTLAVIDGIATLRIDGSDLYITRFPDAEWHTIVNDVTAALRDFFL